MIHSNDPKKFLGTKNSSLSNSVVIKDAQVKLVGATDGKGLVYTDGQPYPPPPAPPTGFVKLDSLQLSNFDTETSARVQEVDQFGQVFFSYKGINNEPEEIIKIDSELDYEVIMQLEWPDAIHY